MIEDAHFVVKANYFSFSKKCFAFLILINLLHYLPFLIDNLNSIDLLRRSSIALLCCTPYSFSLKIWTCTIGNLANGRQIVETLTRGTDPGLNCC